MEIKEKSLNDEEPKIDIEKQSKTINKVLVALIIIIIIATCSLIYYQKIKYKEYYFEYNGFPIHKIRQGNMDIYQIEVISRNQKVHLTSRYDPRELEKISFENGVLNNILDKQELFVTMPSNATGISILAATEIAKILGNPNILEKPISVHGALLEPVEGKDVEVKTCDDVDDKTAIIELKYGNINNIYSEGKCVILEGFDEYSFVELSNRLTLTLIGIIK